MVPESIMHKGTKVTPEEGYVLAYAPEFTRVCDGSHTLSILERSQCCSFVVKTSDDTGQKVFINICHSRAVPGPDSWLHGQVASQIYAETNKLSCPSS